MEHDFKGGPWFGGWLIAAGVGAVALGLCLVVGQFDYTSSVAIAGVIFLLSGIVLSWFASTPVASPTSAPVVPSAKVTPAVVAAESVRSAAAVVAAPVMDVAAPPSAIPKVAAKAAPIAAKPAAKAAPAKPATSKVKRVVKTAPVIVATATPGVATKPKVLKAARGGKADDLKIIKGIGPKLEILCQKLGFFHFDQVAAWTPEEISWVDDNLEGFKGRVTRDRWVPQAKAIVALGATEFLAQLDAGKDF